MTGRQTKKPIKNILIIESNEEDSFIIKTGFKQCRRFKYNFTEFQRSAEAKTYIKAATKTSIPDLIILDAEIDKNQSLLNQIKSSKVTSSAPVIVLTRESDMKTVKKIYSSNANVLMNKPEDFNKFLGMVKKIEQYWFASSLLPELTLA